MNRDRKSITIAVIVAGAVLALCVFQLVQVQRAFGVKDQRVVQILESSDGQFKAELIRRYAFLDLNFFIYLNGEKIFTSPDFKQTYKIPFRETMLWDKTGKNLIFEVGGHRLFGYNVGEKHRLADNQLISLQTQNPKLEDFSYSGQWPRLRSQSNQQAAE